jgi:hypothetical protein
MADYPFTTTTTTGTGDYYENRIWIDNGTGGTYTGSYRTSGPWETTPPADHTYAISKEVTKKDMKTMKDEIRKYMQDQMKEDAKKIAGQLFDDIEKLKIEKTQLKESVTELRNQVSEAKVDIKKELVAIEKLIDKRAQQIGTFSRMDFSQS